MTQNRLVGTCLVVLLLNFIYTAHYPALAQQQKFTGSRSDIIGYLYTRNNEIVANADGPALKTEIEKYPVLFASFGSHCEFFLKNSRQDITQGSRLSERVYFKDVSRITAFRNVPVQSENYGLHIYVGNKRYQINKWSGIARLADDVRGGHCNKVSTGDLIYQWPNFQFKVLAAKGRVKWLDVSLNSIVEFGYSKAKGRLVYDELSSNTSDSAADDARSLKSFEQLKEEAREKAQRRAEEREKEGSQAANGKKLNEQALLFREKVAEGDDSHCGLVIEVKDKVVKVQTIIGEYWLKRSQLYPPDTQSCNFLNGVYQEP